MSDLSDAIEQMLSKEAKQRVKIVAALRKLTTDPEHLELLNTYTPLSSHEGLPLLTINNPLEDCLVLARAAHELIFDFEYASLLCARQMENEACEAYKQLANTFGTPYGARFEFEDWQKRKKYAQTVRSS